MSMDIGKCDRCRKPATVLYAADGKVERFCQKHWEERRLNWKPKRKVKDAS